MMNNIGAFKKKWIENPSDEKGVLLYLSVSEVFISAKFGTGENLLKEDITRGFDDYIYVRKLIFDEDEISNHRGHVLRALLGCGHHGYETGT